MKKLCWMLVTIFLLTVTVHAAQLPEELEDALPKDAARLLEGRDYAAEDALSGGIAALLSQAAGQVKSVLRQRLRGAAAVLLTALLCGVVSGIRRGSGAKGGPDVTLMAGGLSVTLLTAGSLDTLAGLGVQTIDQMAVFSKALLPTLAAVTAAAGAAATASVHQVTTVFFVDILLQLIHQLLLPMVYLYMGVLGAGAMLSDGRLSGIAGALKKTVTWVLSTALLLFTLYLSVVRVISGTADSAAIKLTKTAISGTVPVVGGILSDAAETILAGAGMLKGTVGVFGMLAVLAICIQPFLQLGIQYLLYKLAAFLAATAAPEGLCKLIDGLGGTFGLLLGMTGACAMLLLVSVLSSVAAVTV